MTDLSSFNTLYIQTAKENVQNLKSGLENGDLELAHRSAHTLKSKSILMGYSEIGNLAKIIEDSLYQKNSISEGDKAALLEKNAQIEILIGKL